MAFEGSCHCGKVAYRMEADTPTDAISCNCSHCRRKGMLLAFLPASTFTLLRGEDVLTEYLFNRHQIRHLFCAACGTQAFAAGTAPDGSDVRALNLRCVPEIDLDALAIHKVDGASF